MLSGSKKNISNGEDSDVLALQAIIQQAYADNTALNIIGANSKSWYGREASGEPVQIRQHRGIIHYQPTELIITAKAGTPLSELVDVLDEHKQRLPFDPPYYGSNATIGGTVACGFSGPRRPYAGSCRDFILGCRIINGKGEILRFGAEVMKNVAGFDVSRLMAGSLGTLGVLLDISMKILPHRQAEQTLRLASDHNNAIAIMNRWASSALPITAMAADGQHIYFRICGTAAAVEMTRQQIMAEQQPGTHQQSCADTQNDPPNEANEANGVNEVNEKNEAVIYDDGLKFWKDVREHHHPYFQQHQRPLWRLSVPPATPHPIIGNSESNDWFLGWGGAQRWLFSDLPATEIFNAARSAGGHASLFRGGDRSREVFAPLGHAHMQLQQRLKQAFDPKSILNPGRMYKDL